MGYNTRFEGHLILDRTLTREHMAILERLAETAHTPGEDGTPPEPECEYCPWEPTRDGAGIRWNGCEKPSCWLEWLGHLVERHLQPWGYRLNGEVRWVGDGETTYLGKRVLDQGTIVVRDNVVSVIEDENP